MKNYTHILGIDPSGNKAEGSGDTGMALLDRNNVEFTLSDVRAVDYPTQATYWHGIVTQVKEVVQAVGRENLLIVVEDYRLDPGRAAAQSYSQLETPKLIGVLQYMFARWGVAYMLQQAAVVKKRWSDEILIKKGVLTCGVGERMRFFYYKGVMTNNHKRDALRHAWHVHVFSKEPKT